MLLEGSKLVCTYVFAQSSLWSLSILTKNIFGRPTVQCPCTWWYLLFNGIKIWIVWIYFQEQDRGDRLVMPPPSSLPMHHRGLPKSWVAQSDHLPGPNSNIKGMHFDQLHQPPHTEGRSSCGNKNTFLSYWYWCLTEVCIPTSYKTTRALPGDALVLLF